MKIDLLVRTGILAVAMVLLSQPAAAQRRAGSTFLEIFNVGGVEQTLGQQSGNASGSIGCGNGPPDGGGPDNLVRSDGDIFAFCLWQAGVAGFQPAL